MATLSVVIAAKNEEDNIGKCLESVKWVDEIIIVDDMSTDRTLEIYRQYTDKIFLNDSQGSFHKNKNLGIEKTTGDWIFSLDADEIISPELAEEIKQAIKNPGNIGYYISRKNYFLGRWVKGCGWWPNWIIRLFKKGITRWPLGVHDTPTIKQKDKVGYLRNPLIHHTYQSLNQYFEKFNLYTTNLSQQEWERGARINKKNFLSYFFFKSIFYFFRKYFLLREYKDGFRGFFISFSSALVIFTAYAKLWEKQQEDR